MSRPCLPCIMLVAAASTVAAADPSIYLRVVSRTGGPIPELGVGQVIESLGTPGIGAGGSISYSLSSVGVEGALVVRPRFGAGPVRVALREGGLVNTPFILESIIQHHVLDGGNVAAVGLINGPTTPGGASAIIFESPLGPVVTAHAGMGYGGDGTIIQNISMVRIAPIGEAAMVVMVAAPGGGPWAQALARTRLGPFGPEVLPVLRVGAPLSPTNPAIVAGIDESALAINRAGQLVVPVELLFPGDAEPRRVLVAQAIGGEPTVVLGPGEIIPRPGGACTVRDAMFASIGDSGVIAFSASVDVPSLGLHGATVAGRILAPLSIGRTVLIDAATGEPLGGAPAGVTLAGLYSVWSLSDDRSIVGGSAAGSGIDTGNDNFLAYSSPTFTSLLREYDQVPQLALGVRVAYLSGTIAVSADGFAAAGVDLLGPDFDQSNRFALLLILPDGRCLVAARLGQLIELSPGDARPLRLFTCHPRSNGQDGRPVALARGGRMFFRAEFDEGESAVVEASLAGCNAADVASLGGTPLPDGALTADDVVAFLGEFFEGSPAADLASLGGEPGPDGALTADDVVAFLSAFFTGCP